MLRAMLSLILVALAASAAVSQDAVAPAPRTTREVFAALKKEWETARQKYREECQKLLESDKVVHEALNAARKEIEEAKTNDEKDAIRTRIAVVGKSIILKELELHKSLTREFIPRFLTFAERHPSEPEGFESLALALRTINPYQVERSEDWARAIKLLRAYYLQSARVRDVLPFLARPIDEAADELIREMIARNPDRKVHVWAYREMVRARTVSADEGETLKKSEERRSFAEQIRGKEFVVRFIAAIENHRDCFKTLIGMKRAAVIGKGVQSCGTPSDN